jgi:nitrite reductase/ring-hydroxylating ferredoxin subunit
MVGYCSMPFVRVGSVKEVPPGSVSEAIVNDAVLAVCNVGGEVHVLRGVCPHRGGPLGQGALHDKMLVCPWHAWEFDCTTGQNDYDPSCIVPKYAARTEGDDILVDVPVTSA